jgi:trans-aconitate 2-methyltransferase
MDNWNAEQYRRNSQNQYKWGVELAKKAGIKAGESVLDIGCGDGKITAVIAKMAKGGKTVGADSSSKMLRLAKKMFPASGNKNLSFVKKRAQNMDFKSEFDVVVSNACMHWIKEQVKVLKRISAALKPGGRLFIQMGGKGNAGTMTRIVEKMTGQKDWKKYFKRPYFIYFFPSPAEYKVLLKQSGLKPVNVYLKPKTAKHKGVLGLFKWIETTWLPYTHKVPAEMRSRFINEAVEKFVKVTKQTGKDVIRMPMLRLQVEAVKP